MKTNQEQPKWAEEFGVDYQVPDELTMDADFTDTSWGNDACPIFTYRLNLANGATVLIYCEHPDEAKREVQNKRFLVVKWNGEDGEGEDILETDDIAEAIARVHGLFERPIVAGAIVRRTNEQGDPDARYVVIDEHDDVATIRNIRESGNPEREYAKFLLRDSDIIVPANKQEARQTVLAARHAVVFGKATAASLAEMPKAEFMKSWVAINILSGAHPDEVPAEDIATFALRGTDSWLGAIDDKSGWPIDLMPWGNAAHTRTDLLDCELYAYEAGQAGTIY